MTEQKRQKGVCALFSWTTITTQAVHPPEVHDRQDSRIEDYTKKAVILKQIMSNKARRYQKINAAQNIATVVVSSFLLFFGFSGIDKIQKYASWISPVSIDVTELFFNLSMFLLFLIGTLHLVFRFPDKQSQSEKAVASLASLVNEISDTITTRGNLVASDEPSKIELVRTRYEAIAENIPANSDKEFIRAKRDLAKKEQRKPHLQVRPQQLFDPIQQERIVASIVLGSRTMVDVLIALRETNEGLYLGGGLVRNAVWDYLHGYASPTAVDDVDVAYFNGLDAEKRHDEDLEKKLLVRIPNVHWSVKNQARMNLVNGEAAYASLENAISRWPETATAFVVRLKPTGKLEFIAPYGFDDLLRLTVTNTPAFANRVDVIKKRIDQKKWRILWPRLRISFASDDGASTGDVSV
ncbi:nucleotidyltransferase family protein [Shinella sp. CPCC 100929]|uniref:Nucleotidyltransferase family protein n=1 Tax=Shinella lacus TaxID=2654216 RepID=A0ABT1RIG4_9HYPH|nr:nucleotidyltransferase family protein [Shinella lacus]MCQ4634973.1 nucleotidyltransferase family protein [Shinella lacus]